MQEVTGPKEEDAVEDIGMDIGAFLDAASESHLPDKGLPKSLPHGLSGLLSRLATNSCSWTIDTSALEALLTPKDYPAVSYFIDELKKLKPMPCSLEWTEGESDTLELPVRHTNFGSHAEWEISFSTAEHLWRMEMFGLRNCHCNISLFCDGQQDLKENQESKGKERLSDQEAVSHTSQFAESRQICLLKDVPISLLKDRRICLDPRYFVTFLELPHVLFLRLRLSFFETDDSFKWSLDPTMTINPPHMHPLRLFTSTNAPCSNCQKVQSVFAGCDICRSGLCFLCILKEGYTGQIIHPSHIHPLVRFDGPTNWYCDQRVDASDGCPNKMIYSSEGIPRFRCIPCDYDLCESCMFFYRSMPCENVSGFDVRPIVRFYSLEQSELSEFLMGPDNPLSALTCALLSVLCRPEPWPFDWICLAVHFCGDLLPFSRSLLPLFAKASKSDTVRLLPMIRCCIVNGNGGTASSISSILRSALPFESDLVAILQSTLLELLEPLVSECLCTEAVNQFFSLLRHCMQFSNCLNVVDSLVLFLRRLAPRFHEKFVHYATANELLALKGLVLEPCIFSDSQSMFSPFSESCPPSSLKWADHHLGPYRLHITKLFVGGKSTKGDAFYPEVGSRVFLKSCTIELKFVLGQPSVLTRLSVKLLNPDGLNTEGNHSQIQAGLFDFSFNASKDFVIPVDLKWPTAPSLTRHYNLLKLRTYTQVNALSSLTLSHYPVEFLGKMPGFALRICLPIHLMKVAVNLKICGKRVKVLDQRTTYYPAVFEWQGLSDVGEAKESILSFRSISQLPVVEEVVMTLRPCRKIDGYISVIVELDGFPVWSTSSVVSISNSQAAVSSRFSDFSIRTKLMDFVRVYREIGSSLVKETTGLLQSSQNTLRKALAAVDRNYPESILSATRLYDACSNYQLRLYQLLGFFSTFQRLLPPFEGNLTRVLREARLDRIMFTLRHVLDLVSDHPPCSCSAHGDLQKLLDSFCLSGFPHFRFKTSTWLVRHIFSSGCWPTWLHDILEKFFADANVSIQNHFYLQRVYDLLLSMLSNLPVSFSDAILRKELFCGFDRAVTHNDWTAGVYLIKLISRLCKISSPAPNTVHIGSSCAGCGQSPIVGVRYRCANCLDFDFCEACEHSGNVLHPQHHLFVKVPYNLPLFPETANVFVPQPLLPIFRPAESTSELPVQHNGVTCEHCGCAPIPGYRFLCINCDDYSLCEKCETQLEEIRHFPHHLFLKVSFPLCSQNVWGSSKPHSLIPVVLHNALYPSTLFRSGSNAGKMIAGREQLLRSYDESDLVCEDPWTPDIHSEDFLTTSAVFSAAVAAANLSCGDAGSDSSDAARDVFFSYCCSYLCETAHVCSPALIQRAVFEHSDFECLLSSSMMPSSSRFVPTSVMRLLESLCDPATYATMELPTVLKMISSVESFVLSQIEKNSLTPSNSLERNSKLLELLEICTIGLRSCRDDWLKRRLIHTTKSGRREFSGQNSHFVEKNRPFALSPNSFRLDSLHSSLTGFRACNVDVLPSDWLQIDTVTLLLRLCSSSSLNIQSFRLWTSALRLLTLVEGRKVIRSSIFRDLLETALLADFDSQNVLLPVFSEFIRGLISSGVKTLEHRLFADLLTVLVKNFDCSVCQTMAPFYSVLVNSMSCLPPMSFASVLVEPTRVLLCKTTSAFESGFESSTVPLLRLLTQVLKLSELLVSVLVCENVGDFFWAEKLLEWLAFRSLLAPEGLRVAAERLVSLLCQVPPAVKRLFLQVCHRLITSDGTLNPSLLDFCAVLLNSSDLAAFFWVELDAAPAVFKILAPEKCYQSTGIEVLNDSLVTGSPLIQQKDFQMAFRHPQDLAPFIKVFHQGCERPALLSRRNSLSSPLKINCLEEEATVTLTFEVPSVVKAIKIQCLLGQEISGPFSGFPSSLAVEGATGVSVSPLAFRPLGHFFFELDPEDISTRAPYFNFSLAFGTAVSAIRLRFFPSKDTPVICLKHLIVKGSVMSSSVMGEEELSLFCSAVRLISAGFKYRTVLNAFRTRFSQPSFIAAIRNLCHVMAHSSDRGHTALLAELLQLLCFNNSFLRELLLPELLTGNGTLSVPSPLLVLLVGNSHQRLKFLLSKAIESVDLFTARSASIMAAAVHVLYSVLHKEDSKNEAQLTVWAEEDTILSLFNLACRLPHGSDIELETLRVLCLLVRVHRPAFDSLLYSFSDLDLDVSAEDNFWHRLLILFTILVGASDVSQFLEPNGLLPRLLASLRYRIDSSSFGCKHILECLFVAVHIPALSTWIGGQICSMLGSLWRILELRILSFEILRIACLTSGDLHISVVNFLCEKTGESSEPREFDEIVEAALMLQCRPLFCLHPLSTTPSIRDIDPKPQPLAFDPEISSPGLRLLYDNTVVSCVECGVGVITHAVASTVPSSGIHYWEIEILNLCNSLAVGMANSRHKKNIRLGRDKNNGIGWVPGRLQGKVETMFESYGKGNVGPGDFIGILFNYEEKWLLFCVNGVQVDDRKVFLGSVDDFRPAVGLSSTYDQVRIHPLNARIPTCFDWPCVLEDNRTPLRYQRPHPLYSLPPGTTFPGFSRLLVPRMPPVLSFWKNDVLINESFPREGSLLYDIDYRIDCGDAVEAQYGEGISILTEDTNLVVQTFLRQRNVIGLMCESLTSCKPCRPGSLKSIWLTWLRYFDLMARNPHTVASFQFVGPALQCFRRCCTQFETGFTLPPDCSNENEALRCVFGDTLKWLSTSLRKDPPRDHFLPLMNLLLLDLASLSGAPPHSTSDKSNLSIPPPPPMPSKPKPTAKSTWAGGTGYGSNKDKESIFDHKSFLRKQKAEGECIAEILDVLRVFLSAPTKAIPDAFFALLEDSCLVSVLKVFLRNDSLLEMMSIIVLYQNVMKLLQTMISHPATFELLCPHPDRGTSLLELLTNLGQMADVMRGTIEKASKQQQDIVEKEQQLSFAELIAKTVTVVKAALSAGGFKMNEQVTEAIQTSSDLEREYIRLLKPLQFAESSILQQKKYHYESRANDESKSPSAKASRLMGEVVALSNTLPLSRGSSVFLRIDKERLDVFQALITGPRDTPYSGGCFLFDIYVPYEYPEKPPLVTLMTTGNGTVRFNPNLYSEGKVCLSLLGTWSGGQNENWNSQSSTVLQVLVSIQSLIFVDEPYFNEPGYESEMNTSKGKERSKNYNLNIRAKNVEWAMLDMLRHPPFGFEEVVHLHFLLRKDEIISEIDCWIDDLKGSSATTLKNHRDELKKSLDSLQPHEDSELDDCIIPQ